MGELTPEPINLRESGMDQNGDFIMSQPNMPSVPRKGTRGETTWKRKKNTPEQNEQLGIQNMQRFLLEKIPELKAFLLTDGMIGGDLLDKAREFIERKCGRRKDFIALFGSTSLGAKNAPYFEGSHRIAIRKSVKPWGIHFQEDETRRKPKGYWTPEVIREEVRLFIQTEGTITHTLLKTRGRNDIIQAIATYPGGIVSLREEFNILHPKQYRPKKHRTQDEETAEPKLNSEDPLKDPEILEKEVLEFYRIEGRVSYGLFRERNRFDLISAVKRYPGGILALEAKIGISYQDRKQTISTEEANEWLRNLLQEEEDG